MNAGQDISFFKTADELKKEEKPVSAPAPKEVPETKTDATQTVKTESDGKEAKKDGTEVAKTEVTEKEAQEKLNSLVGRIKDNPDLKKIFHGIKSNGAVKKTVELAKNPSAIGVAGGVGLGTLLATLTASRNDNGKKKRKASASGTISPFLAGVLGATGGYLGGNLLDSVKTTDPEHDMPKGWARTSAEYGKALPKILTPPLVLGTAIHIPRSIAKDVAKQKSLSDFARHTSRLSSLDSEANNVKSEIAKLIAGLKNDAKLSGFNPKDYKEFASQENPEVLNQIRNLTSKGGKIKQDRGLVQELIDELVKKRGLTATDKMKALSMPHAKTGLDRFRNAIGFGKGVAGKIGRGKRLGRLGALAAALGATGYAFRKSWNENAPSGGGK